MGMLNMLNNFQRRVLPVYFDFKTYASVPKYSHFKSTLMQKWWINMVYRIGAYVIWNLLTCIT